MRYGRPDIGCRNCSYWYRRECHRSLPPWHPTGMDDWCYYHSSVHFDNTKALQIVEQVSKLRLDDDDELGDSEILFCRGSGCISIYDVKLAYKIDKEYAKKNRS